MNQADGKWLAWLRDKIPDDFVCGIVLHSGDRTFRLGDRLLAVPIADSLARRLTVDRQMPARSSVSHTVRTIGP